MRNISTRSRKTILVSMVLMLSLFVLALFIRNCITPKKPRLTQDIDAPIDLMIRKYFLFVDNSEQPNMVDISLGENASKWLQEKSIINNGIHETAKTICRLISREKSNSNAINNIREVRKLDRCRWETSDDFFLIKSPMCFERSILMTACLVSMGIRARVVYLKSDRPQDHADYFLHFLVQVQDNRKTVYYDPLWGEWTDTKNGVIKIFKWHNRGLYENEKPNLFALDGFLAWEKKVTCSENVESTILN